MDGTKCNIDINEILGCLEVNWIKAKVTGARYTCRSRASWLKLCRVSHLSHILENIRHERPRITTMLLGSPLVKITVSRYRHVMDTVKPRFLFITYVGD